MRTRPLLAVSCIAVLSATGSKVKPQKPKAGTLKAPGAKVKVTLG